MMQDPQKAKPSQAEGEDPEAQDSGDVEPAQGHPSQAEGEVAPGSGDSDGSQDS